MVSGVWNLPAWTVDDRAPRAISVWVWQPYGSRGPCLRKSSVDEGWMLINRGNALKRSGWKKMAAVPPWHRCESTVGSVLSFIFFCGRKYQQQCYHIRLLFSYVKFSHQNQTKKSLFAHKYTEERKSNKERSRRWLKQCKITSMFMDVNIFRRCWQSGCFWWSTNRILMNCWAVRWRSSPFKMLISQRSVVEDLMLRFV